MSKRNAVWKVFVDDFVQHDSVKAVGGGFGLERVDEILRLKHPADMVAAPGTHAHAPHVAGEPGALLNPIPHSLTTYQQIYLRYPNVNCPDGIIAN